MPKPEVLEGLMRAQKRTIDEARINRQRVRIARDPVGSSVPMLALRTPEAQLRTLIWMKTLPGTKILGMVEGMQPLNPEDPLNQVPTEKRMKDARQLIDTLISGLKAEGVEALSWTGEPWTKVSALPSGSDPCPALSVGSGGSCVTAGSVERRLMAQRYRDQAASEGQLAEAPEGPQSAHVPKNPVDGESFETTGATP